LREIVPGLAKLAILFDATYPASAREAENVQISARKLGLAVMPRGVQSDDDIAPAFDAFKGHADAVYLVETAVIASNSARLVALALDGKLPMTGTTSDFAKAGALVSYGPNFPDMFRRAAEIVDKILRGEKPGDIPVEQPTKFDLVVNVKTANTLGTTTSSSLLKPTEPSSPERQSPRPVARATQFNRRGQTDARSAPDDNCLLLSSIPFSILRNHPTRFRDCPGAVALQFCRGLLPRNAANLHLGSFANTARACVFLPRAYFAQGYFQKIWRGRVDARIGELNWALFSA
jgi:hypothetical protein